MIIVKYSQYFFQIEIEIEELSVRICQKDPNAEWQIQGLLTTQTGHKSVGEQWNSPTKTEQPKMTAGTSLRWQSVEEQQRKWQGQADGGEGQTGHNKTEICHLSNTDSEPV